MSCDSFHVEKQLQMCLNYILTLHSIRIKKKYRSLAELVEQISKSD